MCGEKERVGRTRLSEKKAHSTKGRLRKSPKNSSVAERVASEALSKRKEKEKELDIDRGENSCGRSGGNL